MVQVAYFRGARRRGRRAPRHKTRLTQRGGAIVVPATWAATRFLLRGEKETKTTTRWGGPHRPRGFDSGSTLFEEKL